MPKGIPGSGQAKPRTKSAGSSKALRALSKFDLDDLQNERKALLQQVAAIDVLIAACEHLSGKGAGAQVPRSSPASKLEAKLQAILGAAGAMGATLASLAEDLGLPAGNVEAELISHPDKYERMASGRWRQVKK